MELSVPSQEKFNAACIKHGSESYILYVKQVYTCGYISKSIISLFFEM